MKESRRLAGNRLSAALAGRTPGKCQAVPRAGDPYIKQAALFCERVTAGPVPNLMQRAGMGEDFLLQPLSLIHI